MEEKIIDHYRQRTEVHNKLEEAYKTEPEQLNNETGIRRDAMFKIHIVDAVNLSGYGNHLVRVMQDQSQSETTLKPGAGPIWNEAIIFDIVDDRKPLIVSLIDN